MERLCSSLSVNRLAQPEELQLLQQELARMKSEGAISSSLDDPMAELKRCQCHQLRALEVAEQVAAQAAEGVVAEAAAAEPAAVAAAWVADGSS